MPGVCTTDCQLADPGWGSCRRAAMHASVLVRFIISVFAALWIHPLEKLGFFAAICGGKKDLCVCSTKFETEKGKISKVLEALRRNLFSWNTQQEQQEQEHHEWSRGIDAADQQQGRWSSGAATRWDGQEVHGEGLQEKSCGSGEEARGTQSADCSCDPFDCRDCGWFGEQS